MGGGTTEGQSSGANGGNHSEEGLSMLAAAVGRDPAA